MVVPSILLCIAFLVTGCFNSVITQVIYNLAPIHPKSMVLVFCAYIGYALRYVIKDNKETEIKKGDEEIGDRAKKKRDIPKADESKSVYIYMFFLVFAEIIAAQLSMIAFSQIGSGLHQVLYSSIIFFTALVSAFALRKKIYPMQWVALVILTGGLMLSAGRVNANEVPVEGILYLFASTFICAVTSSLSEAVMKKFNFPSSKYSTYYGFYGSGLIKWVMEPIQSGSETGTLLVVVLMVVLILGQLVRGVVYYKCISVLGSVSTGVLYALQAVCMFSLSAMLFCNEAHPNQCFTITKGIGTLVVSAGVALYSIGGGKQDKLK